MQKAIHNAATGEVVLVAFTPEEEAAAAASQVLNRAAMAVQIDDAVAAVYARFTRFAQEYELREAQAQAFKDAGYSGAVPQQVDAFATPAAMTPQAATDLILGQAIQLRGAMAQLGALRMRKYEVLRAADDATARTALAEVLAGIAAIGAALS